MRRLIIAVSLLALMVGGAALSFAAGGHAASKRPARNIELHWGDHLVADAIKVGCGYSLGPQQQRLNLYCFGAGTKEQDAELFVEWTRGTVTVTRCWNDCASSKSKLLFTARR
jgi:hypothetical protein